MSPYKQQKTTSYKYNERKCRKSDPSHIARLEILECFGLLYFVFKGVEKHMRTNLQLKIKTYLYL